MVLKLNRNSAAVATWQAFLCAAGFDAPTSGFFGAKTEAATKKFQHSAGLIADGIVGPLTIAAARLRGYGKPDLHQRGILPARMLAALRQVESGGKANAVRFEPHVFLGLCPEHHGKIPFTRSPLGWSIVAAETNRAAFEAAFEIAPAPAVKATSWGLYQVLGEHLLDLFIGFLPGSAVAAFDADPDDVSEKLVLRWFDSNPRAKLAAGKDPPDFETVARQFNGLGYRKHNYHRRLQAAWEALADAG